MSIYSSPRFLRNVLLADAMSCVASGVLQLLFTRSLVPLLGLPAPFLVESGWFLLAYAVAVAVIALRDPVPCSLVWLLVVGNAGWAFGCVGLLVGGVVEPTALGTAWLLAQAVTVAVLAALQWAGLRRPRVAAWA